LPDAAQLAHDVIGNRRTDRTLDLKHHRTRRGRNLARQQSHGDRCGEKRAHGVSAQERIDSTGGGPSRR